MIFGPFVKTAEVTSRQRVRTYVVRSGDPDWYEYAVELDGKSVQVLNDFGQSLCFRPALL